MIHLSRRDDEQENIQNRIEVQYNGVCVRQTYAIQISVCVCFQNIFSHSILMIYFQLITFKQFVLLSSPNSKQYFYTHFFLVDVCIVFIGSVNPATHAIGFQFYISNRTVNVPL